MRLVDPRIVPLEVDGVPGWEARRGSDDELAVAIHALRDVHAFDRVFATGGRATDVATVPLNVPLEVRPDARFAARGMLARFPDALVVDVGQTAIKVEARSHRETIPRNGDPIVCFVAQAIAAAPRCEMTYLALPCAIDADGAFGESSYAFEPTFLADLEAETKRSGIVLLNDAELAAIAFLERVGKARTLVLTVGYGIGAALVR